MKFKNERLLPVFLLSSIVLILAAEAVKISFPQVSNFYMWYPVNFFVFIFALVLLGFSIRFCKTYFKSSKVKSLLPILLNLILLAMIIFHPLLPYMQKAEFALRYEARMKAVESYYKNKKEKEAKFFDLNVMLDTLDRETILGQPVSPAGDKLLFYTYTGILESFEGYVYSPDGSAPTKKDLRAEVYKTEKINKHWYYIECSFSFF
ncbi:hypothetical protein CEF21_08775 [Bacillus sp. FJAT-42376]|uniref:hypothetical protein n=1 Tax=Bacillus sp. FJAT-42376 TaxID=2014076 RepID=UPI000F504107|nr:hypothetical protein [Bacillus sp. FJAT-42376]AZB42376.1 hypothetical protein CEF21_08775 [Bacillus sp. FJAT-42376]